MLTKLLIAFAIFLLATKYGLRTKLRQMKPQLDRAVNFVIIGLAIIYVGQLVWWFIQGRSAP